MTTPAETSGLKLTQSLLTSYKLVLVFGIFISSSTQYCLLRSSGCDFSDPLCTVKIRNFSDPADVAPKTHEYPQDLLGTCPDYENVANCCDPNTYTSLSRNFKFLLDPTFGNPDGGCAICSANLKRFWCSFNCDPRQSEFMDQNSLNIFNYTVNPEDPDSWRMVLTMNVSVLIQSVCPIFESCKSVDFARSLGSMQSYQGLFNTLGTNSVTQGNIMPNFSYTSAPNAMAVNVNNCSMVFPNGTDQYGYSLYAGQGWCNCQHCSSNCTAVDFSPYIQSRGLLDGFKLSTIFVAAIIGALIATVGIVIRCNLMGGDSADEYHHADQNDLSVNSAQFRPSEGRDVQPHEVPK